MRKQKSTNRVKSKRKPPQLDLKRHKAVEFLKKIRVCKGKVSTQGSNVHSPEKTTKSSTVKQYRESRIRGQLKHGNAFLHMQPNASDLIWTTQHHLKIRVSRISVTQLTQILEDRPNVPITQKFYMTQLCNQYIRHMCLTWNYRELLTKHFSSGR